MDFDKADAKDRANTEVLCELRRWARRLKERAQELTEAALVKNPKADPEEVGRASAKQALTEQFYIEAGQTPPSLNP